jgi:hypothetical protein
MAWKPRTLLAHAVYAAGFEYDESQDIIKSRLDAPIQSRAGFAWGIDVIGPGALMVLHCETFYFHYDQRLWLIELWKGQYGIETGCEIGVYHRPSNSLVNEPPSETIKHVHQNRSLWFASSTDYLLPMSLKLYRDGTLFLQRSDHHWWLTGFKWGHFSQPSQLRMEGTIDFRAKGMGDQFRAALTATGYHWRPAGTNGAAFTFTTPLTSQPKSETAGGPAQAANERIVARYLKIKRDLKATSNDPNEFVLPAAWLNTANRLVDEAGALAKTLQGGAVAVAARLRADGQAAAARIGHAVDTGASAYHDITGMFQRRRWH